MSDYKQVIVLRKDLNMRKGKMVAQGCHASVKIVGEEFNLFIKTLENQVVTGYARYAKFLQWFNNSQTKICVGVDSEQELLDIYNKATELNLSCSLIQDAGKTEFNGIPTFTAVAIGPDESSIIDTITGNLKLL